MVSSKSDKKIRFHFVMVKAMYTISYNIEEVFDMLKCYNSNIPHYTPLEGGDFTGVRYVFCINPEKVPYREIFEREGYTIEKVQNVEDADIEMCNSGYEVFYNQCAFGLWRRF